MPYNANQIANNECEQWAIEAQLFIYDCMVVFNNYINKNDNHNDVNFVLSNLYKRCYEIAQSILLLCISERRWDAEILLRSLTEGHVKLIYIGHGSQKEMLEKAEEFLYRFSNTKTISRNKKASVAKFLITKTDQDLSSVGVSSKTADKISLMSDKEIRYEQEKYNKKENDSLDRKWSCSELIKYFSQHEDEVFKRLGLLSITYAMESHIAHCDSFGLLMIWQKDQETNTDIKKQRTGFQRIISDVCNFIWLNNFFIFRSFKLDMLELENLYIKHGKLFEKLESTQHILRRRRD